MWLKLHTLKLRSYIKPFIIINLLRFKFFNNFDNRKLVF